MTIDQLNSLSTTTLRILVSVALATILVLTVLAGLVVGHHYTDADIHVLEILGVGLLTMMGLDVTQLFMKRATDNSYVAAKGDADAKVAAATKAPPAAPVVQPIAPAVEIHS